jgi:hypothetical protein
MMKRQALIVAGILSLLAILSTVFFRGWLREAIILPLFYMFWVLGLLYRSIPQVILWGFFLTAILFIAWRSLSSKDQVIEKPAPVVADRPGRVATWERWLDRANQGYYSRWRLARHLADLTIDIIAHREKLSPGAARQYLESGQLEAPPEIRDFLATGLLPPGSDRFSELRYRFFPSTRPASLQLEPREIVLFLETYMEVHRVDRD